MLLSLGQLLSLIVYYGRNFCQSRAERDEKLSEAEEEPEEERKSLLF
jgi:drug/metabolite transporter (DMT)-like permease